LQSCIAYSEKHYSEAASQLKVIPEGIPKRIAATYSFFRGVNILKQFSEAMKTGQKDLTVSAEALADFKKSEALLEGEAGFFVDVARPSALIFRGITKVYENNLDDAYGLFSSAVNTAHAGLQSRAYNDLGYVDLIRGNLNAAEAHFLDSLRKDG